MQFYIQEILSLIDTSQGKYLKECHGNQEIINIGLGLSMLLLKLIIVVKKCCNICYGGLLLENQLIIQKTRYKPYKNVSKPTIKPCFNFLNKDKNFYQLQSITVMIAKKKYIFFLCPLLSQPLALAKNCPEEWSKWQVSIDLTRLCLQD